MINFPKSLLEPKKIIVPGLSGGLQCHGAETAWGQAEKHSRRSEEDSDFRIHHSTGAVENTGENECHNQSTRDSPLVLQAIASGAAISFKQILARLQYTIPTLLRSKGGVTVVARPLHQRKWVEPNREYAKCLPGDQRLANGLGGSMPRYQDRGPLVQGREEASHKLPRVDGSLPGLQILLQEQEEHPCPTKDGQHVNSCLKWE